MYRDPKQWAYVRRLVLEQGGSRRGVSRKTGLSRKTVRKMLACPRPPSKPIPPGGAKEKLLGSARLLAAQRHSIDPIAYRRRALNLWARARDLVLKLDGPQGASLLRDIAEVIDGITARTTTKSRRLTIGCSETGENMLGAELRGEAARGWLNVLLRGEMRLADLGELGPAEQVMVLLGRTKDGTFRQRKKAAVVLANLRGVPIRTIALAAVKFAMDSLLEGDGFEPSVPRSSGNSIFNRPEAVVRPICGSVISEDFRLFNSQR